MMDILDRAKELGQMIAESEEMQRLKRAEEMLDKDEEAGRLMKDYKALQMELVKASRERKSVGDINRIRDMLLSKQSEIDAYKTTFEYFDAKSAFDRFMKNISDVISFAVTGETTCSQDCGACGGCR